MADKISKVCEIKGEPACEFLGSDGCEHCTLYKQNVRQFERRKINDIWKVTLGNLPADVDKFHESEECFFCKKEQKGKREAYAIAEIAHPEPAHETGEAFGLGQKVRRPVGSMIQVPVAVCKDCKRRLNTLDNLRFIGMIIGLALGIFVLWLIRNAEFLTNNGEFTSTLILLLLIALGYQGGKLYQKVLARKYEKQMYLQFFDLPEAKELADLGWFAQNEKTRGKVFVKKEKPRKNFRFIPRQEAPEQGESQGKM